jgi:phospholipid:diacylglycerol acyltransferase
MIENLADIGYDSSKLFMASYDWRLSCQKMEERDAYFSRLKYEIEVLTRLHGERAAIIAHSMGSNVFMYFIQWVTSPYGGNGGVDWVDKHIESFVNIGGALLGVPKTLSTLLSGEMKDTADLNSVLGYIKENLVSNLDLLRLFRSFGSLPSMIPKGGDTIWGNLSHAPDDMYHNTSLGIMLDFRHYDTDMMPEPIPLRLQRQKKRFRREYHRDDHHETLDDVTLLVCSLAQCANAVMQ